MWGHHEVLEGSPKDPLKLVKEGGVVGDAVRLHLRYALLRLEDTPQLGPCLARVAAVLVLFHKVLLNVLPGRAKFLKGQIYSWVHKVKIYH